MTGKIVLTRDQAGAVERIKVNVRNEGILLKKIESPWVNERNLFLNDMSLDDVVRLLYVGYEVKQPSIKIGDWAKHERKEDGKQFIGKITKLEKEKAWAKWSGVAMEGFIHLRDLTKMTPEEIKAEQDRQKWAEIEEGDVVINSTTGRVALFIRLPPESSQVGVQFCRGGIEYWEKQKTALYAKRVGDSDA
ncbi:hypothetical protein [Sporosarcina sp. FA9]|uniref:hypothetical protein n=1 Tax=Sporosarcina sp. FA9 TaxID=3413030 RepID=UPI003F657FB3